MLQAPINVLNPYEERILEFKGLNKKNVVEDGEMRSMYNLSSDEFPSLSQRKGRGVINKPTGLIKIYSMISKQDYASETMDPQLAIIGENSSGEPCFYFGGINYPLMVGAERVAFSEETQMVAINTKICMFPEQIYFDLKEHKFYRLGARAEQQSATMTLDKESGIAYLSVSTDVSQQFKEDDVIKLSATISYSVKTEEETTTTVSIEYSGDKWESDRKKPSISSLVKGVGTYNQSNCILLEADAFLDIEAPTAEVKSLVIEREVPKLTYVMESNNRLWGVADNDNTIYASKLGDPRNWQYYQGTSMDSYYAEQGTDGSWTGCAAYANHLMFFKEGCIHKVYGSSPSSYQITTTMCYGLEKGSNKSIGIMNGMIIYKSSIGFMAYEGDTPYCISLKFGILKFDNAVAGTNGLKYYASIHLPETDEYRMVVCDIDKALWHIEDDTRAKQFCLYKNKMIFVDEKDVIYEIDSDKPKENKLEWSCELGPFDEYVENKKVYSKVDMRVDLDPDTILNFYIKMDNGDWEYVRQITHEHGLVVKQVFVPRRCNKFSIKISGIGRCRIDSLRRQFRQGTGGML